MIALKWIKESLKRYKKEALEDLQSLEELSPSTNETKKVNTETSLLLIELLLENIDDLELCIKQFYKIQSRENAVQILIHFRNAQLTFDKVFTLPPDPFFASLKKLFTYYNEDFQQVHEQFESRLTTLIGIYDGNVIQFKFGKPTDNVHKNAHKIVDINQGNHPSTRFLEGFCYGISLGICWDLLSTGKDSDLSTIRDLEHHMLEQIAVQQNSQSIEDYRYVKKYMVDTEEMKNIAMHTNVFVNTFDGRNLSSRQLAKHIATSITNVFEDIKTNESYAICLAMHGMSCGAEGHGMSLAHINGTFYFIDANTGIYKFNDLPELQEFLTRYLHEESLTLIYSCYQLVNFPQMEQDFPIPESLKSKVIPAEQLYVDRNRRRSHYLEKFWDMAYKLGAIAYDIARELANRSKSRLGLS